jgi:hypothetical protein
VHPQDLQPPVPVGRLHGHAAVEPPGTQQGGVQDLRAVGRPDHHHRLRWLKAVHLGQELVQRLLALVVGPGDARRPLTGAADCVQLVDEDDRRRGLLGRGEQVTHTRRADTHDGLDELRGGDREERRLRLPRHRAGDQRLAGAGRPEQEHAVRDPGAQAHVPVRGLQEIHDLLKLGLHLVDPGHVVKRHPDLRRVHPPRL